MNGEEIEAGLCTSISPKPTDPNVGTGSPSQPTTPTTPAGENPVASTTIPDRQWELVWQDEFNKPEIDLSKWNVMDTGLVYNNELQYYSPSNTSIVKDNGRAMFCKLKQEKAVMTESNIAWES